MPREYRHFKIRNFIRGTEAYHFAQTDITSANSAPYHDHDFHELFWVTRGRGEHLLNERSATLEPGRVFLIRPQDRHSVRGSDASPLRILNLAFPSKFWREVRRRYFTEASDPFDRSPVDRGWLLGPQTQAALERWTARLA